MLQTKKWKECLASIESFLCDKKVLLSEGQHEEVELFAAQMLSAAIQRVQSQAWGDFQKANPKSIPISTGLKFSLGSSSCLRVTIKQQTW
eukprot:10464310-Ditylum_brightwellii.AAC.1